jgi:hypothetical protein
MATKTVSAATLKADRAAFRALRQFQDYTPSNPAHRLETIADFHADLEQAESDVRQAEFALKVARNRKTLATVKFHDSILGAKLQVIAQYGRDSSAVRALGLKRPSDRKRPTRRNAKSKGAKPASG